ncbi:MAG TPA: glutamate 5-kinase [Spirochaetota bacterium]|nr:glutamate 5-kinase [Spirochaetota bacterium]HQO39677.1 glutamate 5-kinase [Spirochaetota bacterium]
MERTELFKKIKRVVVKIGTSSITVDDRIAASKIDGFARQISALRNCGYEVVIVTSGAISAGAGVLGMKRSNLAIPEKQALAAVGQAVLMNEYKTCFSVYGSNVGQVLLTEDDMRHRTRFLNARNTLNALITMNVIPVINENDTVAVNEIKFGDNDTLSAHVYSLVEAELLVLLSDIDGFYNDLKDPEPVRLINRINDDIRSRAGGTGTTHGTGGMVTKVNAAEMIMRLGGMMVIADGSEESILERVLAGEMTGTLFVGQSVKINSRKKWISMRKCKGTVVIDDGAVNAITCNKKSLLAAGITRVNGRFVMGDIVDIVNSGDVPVARGIVNYSSDELEQIKGKKNSEIRRIPGINYFDEVINRDDFILL